MQAPFSDVESINALTYCVCWNTNQAGSNAPFLCLFNSKEGICGLSNSLTPLYFIFILLSVHPDICFVPFFACFFFALSCPILRFFLRCLLHRLLCFICFFSFIASFFPSVANVVVSARRYTLLRCLRPFKPAFSLVSLSCLLGAFSLSPLIALSIIISISSSIGVILHFLLWVLFFCHLDLCCESDIQRVMCT